VALLAGAGFAQSPDVVIRSSVREVLLDVVVRDAHGRLIANLKPDEVTVYEDGVRQDVRSFRLVAGREVRIEDEKQAAEARAAAATPAVPGAAPAPVPVNPLRTVNVVCLVLNDLTADTRTFAFESARKFVNEELRPNTFIGVFSLDSSGLRPVYPFSNNRERLLKAVELASVNQLPAIGLGSAALLNGLSMSVSGVPSMGDTGSLASPLGTRDEMGASVIGALREIDALKGLVRQLTPLPFQKTVVLLSTGFTRPPDLLEYWDSLIHGATQGGITFYAVDVHALDPDYDPVATSAAMLQYAAALSRQQGPASLQSSASQGSGVAGNHGPLSASTIAQLSLGHGPAPSAALQLMELAHEDDYVKFAVSSANTQEALRELAERTGGFLIANTNNVDQLLAHVMEEVDTHYEIAYPPTSLRDDGHFRKIEVKLARTGLRVETRTGYFAVPDATNHPLTPEELAGLRALDTQPRPHAFDFLSRAYRFRDAAGGAQYAIAFEMPISNLTATPAETPHKQRLHASLLAVVKDAHGEIVDRLSKDIPSEVSDEHLSAVRVELMTYQRAVNLPPGRYTVETAVVDHEGNRASTGLVEIDNRIEAGIGISDLALVRRLDTLDRPPDAADPFEYTGKRVLPFVTSDLFAGARPLVYFNVYPEPENSEKPELRVLLLRNGRPLARIKPPLPPADATGRIPMVIEPAPNPGSYELRATIVQGAHSSERTLQYTVE
jgi:VWFA-related protein